LRFALGDQLADIVSGLAFLFIGAAACFIDVIRCVGGMSALFG
jgi:hypothetical protein